MANQVYQVVTDQIISLLEEGTVPWRKPWKGESGIPRSFISGKPYRGINLFLLSLAPYDSPYWLTYKQAQAKGGQVRKGEKSTAIIFWKLWETEKNGEKEKIPVLRYYRVFNTEQVDGLDVPQEEDDERFDHNPIDICDETVEGYIGKPQITHRGVQACYSPTIDVVTMPEKDRFRSIEEYYSVLFHELTHSTGHKRRLDRFDDTRIAAFGSPEYSKEELIAEMGAAFLCGHCGVDVATIDNSAAYISGWLKKLRGDNKLVVQAAAQAQKSTDRILNITWED